MVNEMAGVCPPQSIVVCTSTRDQCGSEMDDRIRFIEAKDDAILGGESYFEVKRIMKDLTRGRSAAPRVEEPVGRRRGAGIQSLKHLGQRRESLVSAFRKKTLDSSEVEFGP
jgi:hypothetical protein